VGFSYSGGTWANFATNFAGAKGGMAGFFAALVAALWAYDGWNDLNMVAGEIRNPQRNIPLALIWGVATVGLLYILVNAAVQYVLPAAAVAARSVPHRTRSRSSWAAGAGLVSAGMAVSMLVTLNGTIMSGARVPFAMARDGYFFKAIAEVHPALPHAIRFDRGAVRTGDRSAACWAAVSGNSFPWRFSPSGSSI
jgi:APA family basic amino acid/polyamine antiporter